ncbi:YdcF family protein [Leptolyngbya sp. FACHB-261]|uniref:YdcF family protein n=1 Tax=Leptolyngbya sp. FACHB-261 TaxID=2692806 RepID=UPI001689ECD4|nr:YdcF family protein [Leptolyngbya sp. FACHB-261]MBD2101214.1 YdcF family protein [Leptolyngbya sp. FACHB-261]
MFQYLSKLLPPFFYPLGLSCLLLLIGVFTFWRRDWGRRLSFACVLTALLLLLLSSNKALSDSAVRSLEWRYRADQTTLPKADAIVVLGGGIQAQLPPRTWPEVAEEGDRVIYGARLYRAGLAPWLVMSGGRVDWLGVGGPPESGDMAALAEAMGVPRRAILEEPSSFNTYENARNVKAILQERGLRRVLLVTSALHMPRSLAIFAKQGIEAIPATTDYLAVESQARKNAWEAGIDWLPNADALRNTSRALREYVGLGVYKLRGWL